MKSQRQYVKNLMYSKRLIGDDNKPSHALYPPVFPFCSKVLTFQHAVFR